MNLEWHMGDVVRKLREQKRWTQTKLATMAGVNKATIVSVEENAPGTKRETYEKLGFAFGLTMGAFFSLLPSDRSGSQEVDEDTERIGTLVRETEHIARSKERAAARKAKQQIKGKKVAKP